MVRGTSEVLNSEQNSNAHKAPIPKGNKHKKRLQSQINGGLKQERDIETNQQRQQCIEKEAASKSRFINQMLSNLAPKMGGTVNNSKSQMSCIVPGAPL